MSELVLTTESFEQEVLKSSMPVLVDFWAPWCGPCRMQMPIVDELANEVDTTKMKVGKLNVDDYSEMAKQFNIMSIPALLVFKDGKVVEQFTGVQSKEKLKAALAKHVT